MVGCYLPCGSGIEPGFSARGTRAAELSLLLLNLVSLFSFGAYPGTHSRDQAGLELTEIRLPLRPGVLGLKACTTNARL
ncbi:hypothetical protein I79_012016 [Cricetulus griseus]|uniref:Uncharacterized protein n=1 Tax=Cricetulus griseus TaxID=10029 RepID=G3HMP5_CRIGR|nr:hypothetical protein I79_012016 [Cricetulus griseus]